MIQVQELRRQLAEKDAALADIYENEPFPAPSPARLALRAEHESETERLRLIAVLGEIVMELKQNAKDLDPYIVSDAPCQIGVSWHRRDYVRWANKLDSLRAALDAAAGAEE